jgi:hypothetical protein
MLIFLSFCFLACLLLSLIQFQTPLMLKISSQGVQMQQVPSGWHFPNSTSQPSDLLQSALVALHSSSTDAYSYHLGIPLASLVS